MHFPTPENIIKIKEVNHTVQDQDLLAIAEHQFRVIEIPGHTLEHIAFWEINSQSLFCGDTLFAAGCGREPSQSSASSPPPASSRRALGELPLPRAGRPGVVESTFSVCLEIAFLYLKHHCLK